MLQGSLIAQGSMVAIVTPMFDDGSLDLNALLALIDWHIDAGTDGIVIVGTTGESPTVDVEEHCLLIKTTVEHVNGRVKVIAGTGANSTSEAIALTRPLTCSTVVLISKQCSSTSTVGDSPVEIGRASCRERVLWYV